MPRPRSERKLLLLVGAVQFVNVLDFMMVMPLGPDFAAALAISPARLGLVGGAYTFAAAISGIAGAGFLDRFDRRSALATAMLGLVGATCAGGFATGLGTMVAARIAAGLFGGPATSLSLSIVADAVPPERRGAALGAVMSAFSVASVLGVPAGLELARLGGWRLPFFAVAGLGLAVAGAALALMPPMRGHLRVPAPFAPRPSTSPPPAVTATLGTGFAPLQAERSRGAPASGASVLRSPLALLSLSGTAASMISGFAIVPNIAAFLQLNLGYPRARLGVLYMAGGAVTFATMRLAGRIVDRAGATAVAGGATLLLVMVLGFGYAWPSAGVPVLPIFVGFMVANSSRNVALNTLASRVPAPAERAGFMSAQSAVQHLASAFGAGLSTRLLSEEGGRLVGMTRVAIFSAAVACALPFLVARLGAGLRAREAARVERS